MTVDGDEKPQRDRVFMDISIGGLPSGRIVFELFNDIAPKTAENFRALCAGDMGVGKTTGKALTYKGMVFHRVVKDFMIQGGDFTNANGTGGESIYGGTFEDETFELNHDRPYLLSMANRGKDTNGSQFFITTQPAPHLDNVHVVFGHVVSGAALVQQLEALPVDRNARPLQDVTVANCGQLVRLKGGKKRKQEKEKTESGEESDKSVKKEKKKKKDKKKKRHQSGPSEEEEGEAPEAPSHPLVQTTKIDPREIPDVPTNRFLMRGGRDQDRDKNDPKRDRERPRFREKERNAYTRSGRIIKGRGVFRYRTPSRSRSRSRSVTPPHWRQAQRRIVKYSDIERVDPDQKDQEPPRNNRPADRYQYRPDEPGTPEGPHEKEEGECDTTMERTLHEKVDYNALDFEEDVEHAEEREAGRRRWEPPAGRAEALARALGVNPRHDQIRDARDARERDFREPRRREGLASAVSYAPKIASAVANVQPAQDKYENRSKGAADDEYDPVNLLRSTFSKNKEKNQMKEDKPDRREYKPRDNKDDRREKYRSERERKHSDRDDKRFDDRKHSESKDDRRTDTRDARKILDDKKKNNDSDKHRGDRDKNRSKDRSERRERSRKREDSHEDRRRDDRRDKDRKKHGSENRSPEHRERKHSSSDARKKSPDKSLDEKSKEVERDKARKELMEIVRLIKSRQKDRESKATESKKKRDPSSDSSDGENRKRRRSRGRDSRSRSKRQSRSPRRARRSSSSH
ncbi:peptidyl-prolyl cis-trans isomerase 8 [Aricia agestis]|uniref:peptidyl-prolyl cis-trans isomerase 8 n=1 Tax=Aricia agestis TaxID=91739 RepID=UPI001C208B44|nr:peptidyl-prolyl cis-trans isomerase 8 [Aricia agestis]